MRKHFTVVAGRAASMAAGSRSRDIMTRKVLSLAFLLLALPVMAGADELTRLTQAELRSQGYEPGAVDGEHSTATAISISRFQAEHGLEVTGEASVPLVGVIKAVGRGRYRPASPQTAAAGAVAAQSSTVPGGSTAIQSTARTEDPADLQARQQACLQEKAEAAKKASKKKRGLGRLARAAGRIANRVAPGAGLGRVTRDVYAANATADDLSAAAKDLGLTEDEVEACRNPPAEVR